MRDELGNPFAGPRGECILATRLGVGTLEALVSLRPLPVSFAVANPVLTELLAGGMGFNEARVLPGASGRGSPGGGAGEDWRGHLVV